MDVRPGLFDMPILALPIDACIYILHACMYIYIEIDRVLHILTFLYMNMKNRYEIWMDAYVKLNKSRVDGCYISWTAI